MLKVANARDLVVVEDDPFADIPPRLAAPDQLDRVIYLGKLASWHSNDCCTTKGRHALSSPITHRQAW
ncbi:hypothetical protein [Brevundimonas naejangsanensis]|uniref:hypothetical protein n=1 Tax=Brevundimonas naejangsanensis TaxID=588932 RepID=UPI00320AF6D4